MNWLRWIQSKLAPRERKPEALSEMYALIQRAGALIHAKDYEDAHGLLLQLAGHRDLLRDPAAVSYLVWALNVTSLFTGQHDDGIAFFSECISRDPANSAACKARAANLWYSGKLREAIRDYSSVLALKPNDTSALSARGQVLAELGENEKAIEDLNLALQGRQATARPENASPRRYEKSEAYIHNGKGFALAGLNDFAGAMAEFEKSISLSPDNAWVYHNRAQVFDRAGKLNDARADYERALKKTDPPLNALRQNHARTRARELSNLP